MMMGDNQTGFFSCHTILCFRFLGITGIGDGN